MILIPPQIATLSQNCENTDQGVPSTIVIEKNVSTGSDAPSFMVADDVTGSLFASLAEHEIELLTWLPKATDHPPHELLGTAYAAIVEHMSSAGRHVLLERIFGRLDAIGPALPARAAAIETAAISPWRPPTIVEGVPGHGGPIAGIHLLTVRPSDGVATQIAHTGRPAGVTINGAAAQYLALADVAHLLPPFTDDTAGAETEAEQVLTIASSVLATSGWSIHDVHRTWFYLRDILAWYDEFNRARNHAFDTLGLARDGRMIIPASTGISGVGAHRRWCVLDLLALRQQPGVPFAVQRLVNPQQNEAPEYGSAFSRGLSVTFGPSQLLLVSGTASIDDTGRSTHSDDFVAQTETTLDTVAALIGTAGAGLHDLSQATAFIKRPADVPAFQQLLERRGLAHLPIVCTIADVCRPELLFELDATALLKAP